MATTAPKGKDKSLAQQVAALRYLPPFLKMVWQAGPRYAALNLLLRLLNAGLPLLMLYVGKEIIDEVLRLMAEAGASRQWLWQLLGIELGLALATALLAEGIRLSDGLLADKFSNQSSVLIIRHAASLDLYQFEDAAFYDKLERARSSTRGRSALMSMLMAQLQDLLSIAALAAGLVAYNPWLILLLLVAVLPTFVSETYFNQQYYALSRSWTPQRRELDYLRFIGASDGTAKEIKIFGLENFIAQRFERLSEAYFQDNKGLALRHAGWSSLLAMIGTGAYYAAYAVIIGQALGGGISLGTLTFLSGAFQRLRSMLSGIIMRFSSIGEHGLYLKDLFDFLAIRPSIRQVPGALPLPQPIRQGLVFEDVGFRYPGSERYAVRRLSFHLRPGEKLALVGENGAGKTTLVKLLARLYEPSEGRILLDGKDLRDYDLAGLRQATGIIFQDYVRFQMRAGENIGIGHVGRFEDAGAIEAAAAKSLADSVVQQLPEGYAQMLGKKFDGGTELSGGQWQKVALARAYMREAQILILDEPTSALDARAEYEVFQRFAALIEGKMAVLISHRFSTVRMADRILFLEKGQIVEAGSHEELLALGGRYAELFHLQAQGYQ